MLHVLTVWLLEGFEVVHEYLRWMGLRLWFTVFILLSSCFHLLAFSSRCRPCCRILSCIIDGVLRAQSDCLITYLVKRLLTCHRLLLIIHRQLHMVLILTVPASPLAIFILNNILDLRHRWTLRRMRIQRLLVFLVIQMGYALIVKELLDIIRSNSSS